MIKDNKNNLYVESLYLRKLKNILGIIIAVVAFCLYAQSISFNYALDDPLVIKDNNLVKQGLSAIPILIKTDRLYGCNDELERMPEYRPVQMVMFAIEWQLFPDNPHFFHLINVLLFSLTCWLLFLLLCKLFENLNLILPFICVILFTVHPIHTEVVDNIKGFDEILCFLFAILSILLFLKVAEKYSLVKVIPATIFFLLSLLSKETGIVYLVLIPLILFVYSKAGIKEILLITITLVVVTSGYFLLRFKILESISQRTIDYLHSPDMNTLRVTPDFVTQKATAFYILLRYIFLLVLPIHQSYDYSFAQIPIKQIYSLGALSGILIYFIMGIYAILKIRKKEIVAFAILFFLITLAPVSNLFLLINWTMAERFLYMPSLGFCMLLSILLIKITKVELNKSKFKTVPQFFKMNSQLFIIVFIIALFYSFRTIARNPDWKDNLTLFSHDVKVAANSSKAHYNYGAELLFTLYPQEKNKEKQNNLLNEAVIEFTKSISIYKDNPKAYSFIGIADVRKGDYANALINYEIALRLFYKIPTDFYSDLGYVYARTGQYEKALRILDSSIKYYPKYTDAYINKSYTYLLEGKNTEAIIECNKLLEIDSKNVTAFVHKGCAYSNLKQYKIAIENLNHALDLDSTNADCLRFLGTTYKNMGDTLKAKQYFEKENMIRNERE